MSARFRLLPTVLLVSGLITAPLFAQDQGAAPPPPGGQGGPGGGMRGPGGGRPMMDPTLIDGPLMPEEFAALAGLDSKQEGRYETAYQALMTNTRTDRATLKDARDKRRQQMASGGQGQGDRDAMRAEREKMRPAFENLQKQQETFDKALKDFLKPDQLKKYDDWKEQKREEMRAQFGGGQGRRS